MALALAEARAAAAEAGEVPVGAVAVVDGAVVAARHNEREASNDPTAHAEMLALRDVAAHLGGWRLHEVTLLRDARALPHVRRRPGGGPGRPPGLRRRRPRAGACGTLYNLCVDPRLNHELPVTAGRGRGSSAVPS